MFGVNSAGIVCFVCVTGSSITLACTLPMAVVHTGDGFHGPSCLSLHSQQWAVSITYLRGIATLSGWLVAWLNGSRDLLEHDVEIRDVVCLLYGWIILEHDVEIRDECKWRGVRTGARPGSKGERSSFAPLTADWASTSHPDCTVQLPSTLPVKSMQDWPWVKAVT